MTFCAVCIILAGLIALAAGSCVEDNEACSASMLCCMSCCTCGAFMLLFIPVIISYDIYQFCESSTVLPDSSSANCTETCLEAVEAWESNTCSENRKVAVALGLDSFACVCNIAALVVVCCGFCKKRQEVKKNYVQPQQTQPQQQVQYVQAQPQVVQVQQPQVQYVQQPQVQYVQQPAVQQVQYVQAQPQVVQVVR